MVANGNTNKNQNPHQNKNQISREPDYEFDGIIESESVLEMMPRMVTVLRSSDYNYLASQMIFICQLRKFVYFGLKTGDTVKELVRPPKKGRKYFPLVNVENQWS